MLWALFGYLDTPGTCSTIPPIITEPTQIKAMVVHGGALRLRQLGKGREFGRQRDFGPKAF